MQEWSWANRERAYRVRFMDGDEYLLNAVHAAQDIGGPPHATADVQQTIVRAGAAKWSPGNAIFFHLLDVAEVTNALTGELVFRAPTKS